MRTIREHLEIIAKLARQMAESPACMGAADIDRLEDIREEVDAAIHQCERSLEESRR